MHVLVLGRNGQVARHLRRRLPDAAFWGRGEQDMRGAAELERAIVEHEPAALVNAAAYTAVDRAESEAEAAWRINTDAAAAAAAAARALGIPVIHLSTDYVFDGRKGEPYETGDAVRPLGVYGASKLGGELGVRSLAPRHWILRTSWIFSEFGSNFVKTMLRLAGERARIDVVADQRGVPTYAGDVADVVCALLGADSASVPWGTYHAVGGPEVSWHDFAREIFAVRRRSGLGGGDVVLGAIPSSQYPTAAERPARSTLAPSSELLRTLGVEMDWQVGLEKTLRSLADNHPTA